MAGRTRSCVVGRARLCPRAAAPHSTTRIRAAARHLAPLVRVRVRVRVRGRRPGMSLPPLPLTTPTPTQPQLNPNSTLTLTPVLRPLPLPLLLAPTLPLPLPLPLTRAAAGTSTTRTRRTTARSSRTRPGSQPTKTRRSTRRQRAARRGPPRWCPPNPAHTPTPDPTPDPNQGGVRGGGRRGPLCGRGARRRPPTKLRHAATVPGLGRWAAPTPPASPRPAGVQALLSGVCVCVGGSLWEPAGLNKGKAVRATVKSACAASTFNAFHIFKLPITPNVQK